MTPRQCRAARAILGWSQFQLDQKSRVTKGQIAHFENLSRTLSPTNRIAVTRTLEAAGIEFLDEATHGVRWHGYPSQAAPEVANGHG